MKREGVSKKRRFDVFKRDLFVCQYCGGHPPDVILEVDHIIPVKEGGRSLEGNLVTACFNCNRGKAAESLSIIPKSLQDQGAEVEEREEQLAGYREIMQRRQDRIEADMWLIADALEPKSSEEGMRRDWLRSIKTFNERLPLHEVLDAAEIAFAAKPWSKPQRFRYFCGVCWNKIKRAGD